MPAHAIPHSIPRTRREQLAERLQEDIRLRRLECGQKYITAETAARLLGVSRMTAHRAMELLVARDLLVRKRGQGTFVGPAVPRQTDPVVKQTVKHVHFIHCGEGETMLPPLANNDLLRGLMDEIPDTVLHTHLLPFDKAEQCVRELLNSFENEKAERAFLLTLSPREVQRLFMESNRPTVVIGSVFPGINLPTLEADQTQIGRHLIRLAYRLGGRRFVFINGEHWRRGDSRAFDGLVDELAKLGLPANRVAIRNHPHDMVLTKSLLEDTLTELEEHPSDKTPAFLCRSPLTATLVRRLAKSRGLRIPGDLVVAYDRPWIYTDIDPEPHVADALSVREGVAQLAQMLKRGFSADAAAINSVRVPSRIQE